MQLQTVKLRYKTKVLNCLFMKYIIILISLFLLSFFSKAQIVNTLRTESTIGAIKTSNYIIGIGNPEKRIFNDVLDNLKSKKSIKVTNVCEAHKLISFLAEDREFEDFKSLEFWLKSQFPDLLVFKKSENILNIDCKDEILKQ